MKSVKPYCIDLYEYHRLKSREVFVGDVPMGAGNPLRIQSMTTTDTMDTAATVAQSIRMIEAGCEYVRITAPSKKEALNLKNIKEDLRAKGYNVPLIADIHFTPNAAEIAAGIVEKVRVNPGNFADKKKFDEHIYSDESYKAEIDRIRDRFSPLVKLCKERGIAMRIGTNHGSLSDRIMSRYGDTPEGMVESAMEFVGICRELDFHNIVLSMKASNPIVMVHAYRLLTSRMIEMGTIYPLHLGVTEAGEGEDGRIKSSMGIGTLLEDGIGDTIRVSLTEDPEFEMPVAIAIANRYNNRNQSGSNDSTGPAIQTLPYDPYSYQKRMSRKVLNFGDSNVPRVVIDLSSKDNVELQDMLSLGYRYSKEIDKWNLSDQACDFIYLGNNSTNLKLPGSLGIILDHSTWKTTTASSNVFPLLHIDELNENITLHPHLNFVFCSDIELNQENIKQLNSDNIVLVLQGTTGLAQHRKAFIMLMNLEVDVPVIISKEFMNTNKDDFQLYASTDAGGLLLEGMGDGLWFKTESTIELGFVNRTCFGILQASRTRISKTEYISCPSCGRTLFDLQETTARIRKRTEHLKGVKIGIMGCIVNGPGEMADADYGYVGTGHGKITLYKGKEVVHKNIDTVRAVDALIELIKQHGDWIDPVPLMEGSPA